MQPHHEHELRLRLERLYFETWVTLTEWELRHWYRQLEVTGEIWRDIAERFDRWFETYGGQILVFRDEKTDGPYRLVFHSPRWYEPIEALFDASAPPQDQNLLSGTTDPDDGSDADPGSEEDVSEEEDVS